tara:strand:+ start:129 stop:365 length:237 start_codon:yes stop_codon:yes gene_type:complete
MIKDIKNEDKRCGPRRNMIIYGSVQLSCSIISALSLAAIAFGISAAQKDLKLFDECVTEQSFEGKTISASVHFCNGGN